MAVRPDAQIKRIRYLLGLSSQSERECIESEYFEDGVAFQAMLAAEDDLIDAYARGELTAEERQRFETHFLTSVHGRDRVQFARAFAGVVSSATPVRTTTPGFSRWSALRVAMVAAVIVLVVALSWIFVQRRRLRNEVRTQAELSKQSETLPPNADVEQTSGRRTLLAPERFPVPSDKPKRRNRQTIVGLGTRNITKPDASVANNSARKDIKELPLNAQNVASLLILDPLKNGSAGTIGSRTIESSGRTTITLAHSITSITLHLRLDVAKPHREYRAVIETAAGRPVTTLSWSTFTFSNIVDTPSLRAVDLPAGDYKLFLAGKISNGSFVRVAEFSFRVIRNK